MSRPELNQPPSTRPATPRAIDAASTAPTERPPAPPAPAPAPGVLRLLFQPKVTSAEGPAVPAYLFAVRVVAGQPVDFARIRVLATLKDWFWESLSPPHEERRLIRAAAIAPSTTGRVGLAILSGDPNARLARLPPFGPAPSEDDPRSEVEDA